MKFVLIFLVSFAACGEELGDAAKTRVLLPLYADSSTNSRVIGKLPAGTVVRYKGERTLPLILVEVELEDRTISGWVLDSELDFGGKREVLPERKSPPPKFNEAPVPTDEQILLARENSFLYGAYLGGNYGFVSPAVGGVYQGSNFLIGARLGLFAGALSTWELHADYELIGGYSAGATTTLVPEVFGYFNVLGVYTRRLGNLDLMALGGVAFGASLPDSLPAGMVLNGASDLTSPVLGAGVGYRYEMSPFARLSVMLQYRIHIFNVPSLMQSLVLAAGLSFEG
ncbi:MAG: SH3 domain-containing protein [Deltaproteobacteria bacterium]|nr:SH3 domain-containing protein [Deltaproteobacteria bacterium]MBI3294229.1 SH3 domain-containing protein [Deltaproteobacteria bacterium]